MRRLLILLLAIFTTTSILSTKASTPSKIIKAEVKALKKSGWIAKEGTPSIEEQVAKYLKYMGESDDNGDELYYIIESRATAAAYTEAQTEALYWCEALIIGRLFPENISITYQDNVATSATVKRPDNLVLAPQIPLINLYRTKNDKTEVMIICAYERSKCVIPK